MEFISNANKKLKEKFDSRDPEIEPQPIEAVQSVDAEEPVKMAGDDEKDSSSNNDFLYRAIIGIAPSLVGAALGGYEGGAAGGKASSEALKNLGEYEEKDALKKQEIAAKKAENDLTRQMKREEYAINKELKRIEFEGKRGEKATDRAFDLRREYAQDPTTKRTKDIADAYQRMEEGAKTDSPAGDLSLIYQFMKILDPGSTVREGEQANAENAGSVPDRIYNLYNKARKGERLSPKQRADFIGQAKAAFAGQMKNQESLGTQYKGLAQRYGASPDDVVLPIGQYSAEQLAGQPKKMNKSGKDILGGQSAQAAVPKMDYRSMSTEQLEEELMQRKNRGL